MPRSTDHHRATLVLALFLSVAGLSPLAARVTVSPRVVDFGERGHNESPEMTIEVRNEFPQPVQITRVKPSCSCIKVSPSSLQSPLAPGSSARFTVGMSSGRAFGRLTKYLEIAVSGDSRPLGKLRVPITMKVFENYHLEPRELRFEGEYGGAPVTVSALLQSRSRRNGQPLNLKFVRIRDRSRGPESIARAIKVTIDDRPQGALISATLSPMHPEGRISGELEALLDGKPLVLPIVGDMFRGLLLSPKYFNFNRVETAEATTHEQAVIVRAIDGRAFEILNMTSRTTRPQRDPGFSVELSVDAGQDVRDYVVRARLVASGGFPVGTSFSGKVSVHTTHPEKPTFELGFFGFFAKPTKRTGSSTTVRGNSSR